MSSTRGEPCIASRGEGQGKAKAQAMEGLGQEGQSSGKWTDEQCDEWLAEIEWKPSKITEDQAQKILVLDPMLLPDTEDDASTLAGVLFRLQQFEAWWETYWRKVSKVTARVAFFKATTDPKVIDEIHRGAQAQHAEMLAREIENRPHASTWLNQERWRDEVGQPDESKNAWTH